MNRLPRCAPLLLTLVCAPSWGGSGAATVPADADQRPVLPASASWLSCRAAADRCAAVDQYATAVSALPVLDGMLYVEAITVLLAGFHQESRVPTCEEGPAPLSLRGRAVRMYEYLVRDVPDRPDLTRGARIVYAAILVDEGRFQEAAAALEPEFDARGAWTAEEAAILGEACFGLGRYTEAASFYRIALLRHVQPTVAEPAYITYKLGRCYALIGWQRGAVKALRDAAGMCEAPGWAERGTITDPDDLGMKLQGAQSCSEVCTDTLRDGIADDLAWLRGP
jgi:hypothetical protein